MAAGGLLGGGGGGFVDWIGLFVGGGERGSGYGGVELVGCVWVFVSGEIGAGGRGKGAVRVLRGFREQEPCRLRIVSTVFKSSPTESIVAEACVA